MTHSHDGRRIATATKRSPRYRHGTWRRAALSRRLPTVSAATTPKLAARASRQRERQQRRSDDRPPSVVALSSESRLWIVGGRSERALDRKIEADELVAVEDQIGFVHVRALDREQLIERLAHLAVAHPPDPESEAGRTDRPPVPYRPHRHGRLFLNLDGARRQTANWRQDTDSRTTSGPQLASPRTTTSSRPARLTRA